MQRRRSIRAIDDQPITDLGNCLDPERAFANTRCDLSNSRQSAIDRVLADDPAVPAPGRQLVAGDDAALGEGECDQYLHHARLDRLLDISADHLPGWRVDRDVTERERGFVGKIDLAGNRQSIVSDCPHDAELLPS